MSANAVLDRMTVAPVPAQRERRSNRFLVWTALGLSFVPLGFSLGLPFSISPADALMPLLAPYALLGRTRSTLRTTLVALIAASLAIVLAWSLLDSVSPIQQLQSLVFFWKPWVALLVAYRLVSESADVNGSAHRVLAMAAWAQALLIGLVLAGLFITGTFIAASSTATGLSVTGFTAGTWGLPVALYGYGQVNVTAGLLAIGVPIIAAHAFARPGMSRRFAWLALIPISWFCIINSGSRGAVLTSLLFVVLLFLNRRRATKKLSVATLALTLILIALATTQVDRILEASPKYQATISSLAQNDAASVASGRNELAALVISDLQRSPFWGTGFGDFARFHTATEIPWVNSSPHNTYLSPLHKGGIFVGIAYLVLLLRVLPFNRLSLTPGTEWLSLPFTIAILLGLFPFIDALTTPVLGGTILALCGMLVACQEHTAAESPPAMTTHERSAATSS